jgi:8-oxo-dGTP diphosphatase
MNEQWIHVVAAVIENDKHEVLIAKRAEYQHQGGLWEFPGGKVEVGETAFDALQRELKEELDISIHVLNPFIKIWHKYPDSSIFLDIYTIYDFDGLPKGNEGQQVKWVSKKDLLNYNFPKANEKIVKAITCPEIISITAPNFTLADCTKQRVEKLLSLNVDAVLLRTASLNDKEYMACVELFDKLTNEVSHEQKLSASIKLFINRPALVQDCHQASGLHLSVKELIKLPKTFKKQAMQMSASCHNEQELKAAQQAGCDFLFVSPVKTTNSHRESTLLTWQGFENLVACSNLPCIALGGMDLENLVTVKERGGFGVAGISNFGLA